MIIIKTASLLITEKMLIASVIIASISLVVSLVTAVVMAVYFPRVIRRVRQYDDNNVSGAGVFQRTRPSATTIFITGEELNHRQPSSSIYPELWEKEGEQYHDAVSPAAASTKKRRESVAFPLIHAPACPVAQ